MKKALIIIFAVTLIILPVNLFGKVIARKFPRAITYFSFSNGPFSWSYRYQNGVVGIFEIGKPVRQTIEGIYLSGKTYRYYSLEKDGVNFIVSNSRLRDIINNNRNKSEYYFVDVSKTPSVNYIIESNGKDVVGIRASSSILAGL